MAGSGDLGAKMKWGLRRRDATGFDRIELIFRSIEYEIGRVALNHARCATEDAVKLSIVELCRVRNIESEKSAGVVTFMWQ